MAKFQKGMIPWNKGKPFSEGVRKKMAVAKIGKHGNHCTKHSEESKRKMSISHIGIQAGSLHPMYGKVGHMLGKHHSEETRLKIGIGNKGKHSPLKGVPRTEETKRKISNAHKRRKLSRCQKFSLSGANKGKVAYWKGKHHSEETRNKMRLAKIGKPGVHTMKHSEESKMKMSKKRKGMVSPNKGKVLSQELKDKIRKTLKERYQTTNLREKISLAHKGIKQSDETKRKRAIKLTGSLNPCWNGGSSFVPYSCEFNKKFKECVKLRDGYVCVNCKKNTRLFVHHIDYNKDNTSEQNCVSLCNSCHSLTNHNREYWINYYRSRVSWKESRVK